MRELISVILPAYNAAETLDHTLRSVRFQTYRDIEILVIDDGSVDETPRIAERHAATDHRIRIIRQANGGVAAARNKGIAEAKGNLIAPIDADDLWSKTKLEKQAAMMADGGPIGLVYCWYAIIDAGSIVQGVVQPTASGKVLSHICANNIVGSGSAPLMRKDVIEAVGSYSTQLREVGAQGCEDWLLYLRIAERYEYRVVKECLVGYRVLPSSMSRDGRQMLRSFQLASRDIMKRHPAQLDNLLTGEFNLCTWLIQRALAGKRLGAAAHLFINTAAKHPKRMVSSFIPEMLKRSGIALYRLVRPRNNTFEIGSA